MYHHSIAAAYRRGSVCARWGGSRRRQRCHALHGRGPGGGPLAAAGLVRRPAAELAGHCAARGRPGPLRRRRRQPLRHRDLHALQHARQDAVRHPGLRLNTPPWLFCVSWCPEFEFRGHRLGANGAPAFVGARADLDSSTYFAGGMAAIAIYSQAVGAVDAHCLFEYGDGLLVAESLPPPPPEWVCADDPDGTLGNMPCSMLLGIFSDCALVRPEQVLKGRQQHIQGRQLLSCSETVPFFHGTGSTSRKGRLSCSEIAPFFHETCSTSKKGSCFLALKTAPFLLFLQDLSDMLAMPPGSVISTLCPVSCDACPAPPPAPPAPATPVIHEVSQRAPPLRPRSSPPCLAPSCEWSAAPPPSLFFALSCPFL